MVAAGCVEHPRDLAGRRRPPDPRAYQKPERREPGFMGEGP